MSQIPIVAFAAYSGTGKTTLIEKLIRELKKHGLRLALLKHDGHHFEIDHEGKDSWRFTKAGADITMISSPKQTAYIEQGELPLERLLGMIHDVDLILVEGYKNEDLPQIGIARKATGKGFTSDVERFITVVADFEVETSKPCFGFEETEALARWILEKIVIKETKAKKQ